MSNKMIGKRSTWNGKGLNEQKQRLNERKRNKKSKQKPGQMKRNEPGGKKDTNNGYKMT